MTGALDLTPLGDRAFLARFDDEAAARAWFLAARGRLAGRPGVLDVVLAYRSAAVYADPDGIDLDALEAELHALVVGEAAEAGGVRIDLPVLYEGDDLEVVAGHFGCTPGEIVARHTAIDFQVFAVGFLPGFPYAGYLPEGLRGLARRREPRRRVPAGSVAIAGRQTGVYPEPSPGGWHLLGRTPLTIADLRTGRFPIQAGDRLWFHAIDADEFHARVGEPLVRPQEPAGS